MNNKIKNFITNTKGCLSKHSPEILTGIGIAGMVTSTVLAVKATPKAVWLLEEARDIKGEKLTVIETIKTAWTPYIPSLLTGMASISCIVGAGRINSKRNAALATAYSISEKALLKYRDKVIETIGEKKEKEIRNKVAQEEVNDNPVSKSHIIVTSKGNTLCMDTISGRYFKSDIDTIKKIVNELNRDMMYQNYISLDEFYSKIGLPSIKNGSYLGWNIDNGFIEIDFGAALTEEGEPCLVLDFERGPEYDFNKLS